MASSLRNLTATLSLRGLRLTATRRSMGTVALNHNDNSNTNNTSVKSEPWISKNAPTPNSWRQREMAALEARLQINFNNKHLLTQALTHRSSRTDKQCNSRLALLGDSYRNFFLTSFVLKQYPNLPAAAMKDVVDHLMEKETVSKIASQIGVNSAINAVKKIEDPEKNPFLHSIIRSAYNGLTGAILEDQGVEAVNRFLSETTLSFFADLDVGQFVRLQHPKLMLRHLLKEAGKQPPVTRLLSESGRTTHLPVFLVGVFSGSEKLGEAASWSLKKAEHEAALAALRTHYGTELSSAPFPSELKDFAREGQIRLISKNRGGSQ